MTNPITSAQWEGVPPLLTRRQAVVFLREKRGIPISFSRFAKLRMEDKGPVPDAYWGKYELFKPATLVEWSDEGLRPSKSKTAA